MADTPILNYKGKYDGPEIDKAVELALGLKNPESCPYYVHISLSQPDYVLTIGLGDAEGNLFNHAEIDLPLESMVVNATYENGNIILHLQDGTSTEPIPISALIAGLVSETRTIAGIDLKDNITQKELRDALDVYTKDSVDQLVSDLEDRIDETLNEMKQSLNDLSDLTSEHDTQIKKNSNDIAVNRATLGMQCKNLFDKDGNINMLFNGVEVNDPDSINTVDNNVITFNRNSQKEHLSGKVISNLKGKRLIISFNILSFGTGTAGSFRIQKLYDGTALLSKSYGTLGQKTEEFTSDEDVLLFVFGISSSPNTGKGLQIENLMIRSADITDSTYEPYKPSVNDRLGWVEESVSELTPQVEQNKSDILSAKNDIAVNNSTIGTRSKNCLEITATSKTAEETGGLTITVNDDKSITINGTASASGYRFTVGIFAAREIKRYLLSGCPSGGGNKKYQLYSENNDFAVYNAGGESGFTPKTKGRQYFTIIIYGNVECNNLIFYPMVRYADIADGSYEPYKPSLQEQINALVAEIAELKANQTTVSQ